MSLRLVRSLALATALAGTLSSCSSPPPAPPPDPEVGARPEYRIGAGDVLRVVVWKNAELSVEVPVRPDGRVSVPLVNDIQAEGLTPEELADLVAAELAEYISAPTVSVVVRGVDSKQVYVIGEVVRSGPQPLNRELRVLDVLTMAGGFREFADRGHIRVIRGDLTYVFDYDAYVRGKAPGTNLVLENGDVVVVSD